MILRRFKNNTLFFVNQRTLNFFIEMENIFRATISSMESYGKINLRKYFIQRFDTIPYFLPDCHKLRTTII